MPDGNLTPATFHAKLRSSAAARPATACWTTNHPYPGSPLGMRIGEGCVRTLSLTHNLFPHREPGTERRPRQEQLQQHEKPQHAPSVTRRRKVSRSARGEAPPTGGVISEWSNRCASLPPAPLVVTQWTSLRGRSRLGTCRSPATIAFFRSGGASSIATSRTSLNCRKAPKRLESPFRRWAAGFGKEDRRIVVRICLLAVLVLSSDRVYKIRVYCQRMRVKNTGKCFFMYAPGKCMKQS